MRDAALVVIVVCIVALDLILLGAIRNVYVEFGGFPWGVVVWLIVHLMFFSSVILSQSEADDD